MDDVCAGLYVVLTCFIYGSKSHEKKIKKLFIF